MFSDNIFDAKMAILSSLRIDNAYPEIYDADAVINMLAHLNMVMLLSDQREPDLAMTEARKLELYAIALINATEEYNTRMIDGYETD